MTLVEYMETPETTLPQELIYGVMRVADAPFVSHQRVVLKLAFSLTAHAEAEDLGEVLIAPTDVVLDASRALVLQPDLLFVSRAREHIVSERILGAPDLVVEVLSPRPRIGTLEERVNLFASHGVPEIWIYHQLDRQLTILSCADRAVRTFERYDWDDPIRSGVLPRFDLTVRQAIGR